ncbi:IS30 family transposase [Candidatus Parcubacteria bacterium]|nr:IS30 family transposase [Candidatus Parcubacteria bacterium]
MSDTDTERKSRLTVILRPKDKTAKSKSEIINKYFKRFPIEARKTMTFDNGLEFADHQAITKSIGTKIFFAKPYSSWQRGSNENGNGLIRWYLPRNTDLNSLTDEQLNAIMELINNRPKKCLGFKTPNEIFLNEMSKIYKSKPNLFNSSVALRS